MTGTPTVQGADARLCEGRRPAYEFLLDHQAGCAALTPYGRRRLTHKGLSTKALSSGRPGQGGIEAHDTHDPTLARLRRSAADVVKLRLVDWLFP